ncbi:MAG: cytochrome c1 [Parvularculales bacterium]
MRSSALALSLLAIVGIAGVVGGAGLSWAAGEQRTLKQPGWSFEGPFGLYDRDALRRGYQVYTEVCASCHSMRFLSYRNLGDEGGPAFSAEEVKALAAEHEVEDGPDQEGDMFTRPALPKDAFVSPFPNEQAARVANGGALPPDLSLVAKSYFDGSDYIYSLLTGYGEAAPEGVTVPGGQYYNPYFSGGLVAMAPPLSDEIVDYADGTPETVDQMARDVVQFLTWAAEPKMEERKRIGFQVLIYLVILAGLFFFAMRKVWTDAH